MPSAVRRLIRRSLDYAGLFPPAALALPTALTHYAAYRSHPDSEMLAQFVMPLDRLEEAAALLPAGCSWQFSGLLRDPDPEGGRQKLDRFCRKFPLARFGAIEAAPPADLALTEFLSRMRDSFRRHPVFVELDWRSNFAPAMDALVETWEGFGAKLRTGGQTPDRIPPANAVAAWLAAAAARQLPIKATAGLHEAFPHVDRGTGIPMHGFLNVMVAALAAWNQPAGSPETEAILAAGPDAFEFRPDSIRCRKLSFHLDQIDEMRASFFRSFGSCSFLEPVEDLEKLDLLP